MRGVIVLLIAGFLLVGFSVIYNSIKSEDTVGNTLYVGGSGEGNYSSIRDAINNAINGSTIYVYSGKYYENISINKSITLIGQNTKDTVIYGQYDIIDVRANRTNISDLTIKWFLKASDINRTNIGIKIVGANNCNIKNNIIIDGQYGIYLSNSYNNNIENNTISNNSYGIFLSNQCKNNTIFHNNFINNSNNSYDEGNTTWFNLNQGNYWDDYTGLDKNNDGIGDKPYEIPGGNNIDEHPLIMPYDGRIRPGKFFVEEGPLYTMLIIGMIAAILFCLPIGYIWYRKYHKLK